MSDQDNAFAPRTVGALAAALGLEAEGDLSLPIGRPAHPSDAGPGDLAMAMAPSYAEAVVASQARAAMLWPDADRAALGLEAAIFAPRPRFAMAGVTQAFARPVHAPPGVHESAVVDPSAELGEGVSIGPFCIVGAGRGSAPGRASSVIARSARAPGSAMTRCSIPACASPTACASARVSSRSPTR